MTSEILAGNGRRQAMAQQLGVDESRVRGFRMDLSALRNLGTFVRVEVSGNTIWHRRAGWDSLGIADGDARQKRLTRGRRNLISPERIRRFNTLESRARQNLDAFGTPLNDLMPGMIAWRFLTVAGFHAWHARHELVCLELEQAKNDLIEAWPEVTAESRRDFAREASEVWRSLDGRRAEAVTELRSAREGGDADLVSVLGAEVERISELLTGGRLAFVQAYVEDAMAQLPNEAQIRAVRFTWYSNILESDVDVAAVEREAAQLRLAGERDATEAQNLRAMRMLELAQAQEYLETATSPLLAAAQAAEQRVADAANEILQAIQRKETLSRPLARRAGGLAELYRLVRVTNRADLEGTLSQLEQLVAGTGASGPLTHVETNRVAQLLIEVADLTASEAMAPVATLGGAFTGLDLDFDDLDESA